MKRAILFWGSMAIALILLVSSCETPITLVSWKDPAKSTQVSKVCVMPLFEKLQYMRPFEQSVVSYFNDNGLKAIGSLEFLNPNVKYEINDVKRKCDSVGADAILVFIYKGVDKTESYVPPSTYYSGYYGNYGGYWGGGYWGPGYWGPTYSVGAVTTGGYWETTATINLTAKLFVKGAPDGIWTGDIAVTDPTYIDEAAYRIAKKIFADLKSQNLVKIGAKK